MEITNYKSQTTNNTQITNNKSQTNSSNTKKYDLEKRTLEFAKSIIGLCRKLRNNIINQELIRQIVRSGCSVGANYREASEALSKKDFRLRMRISRKECKETTYWLELIDENNPDFGDDIKKPHAESLELRNIFTAIIDKSS